MCVSQPTRDLKGCSCLPAVSVYVVPQTRSVTKGGVESPSEKPRNASVNMTPGSEIETQKEVCTGLQGWTSSSRMGRHCPSERWGLSWQAVGSQ